jgi:endonuclease/exonuclease/phosphatase family metal-dependent hydrolase
MTAIKLITYNMHKGFMPGKVRFVLERMRQALMRENPDLIFLQEVQGEHKRQEKRIESWPGATQFEYIAEELWPHYAYGKNAIYQAGHHGNALLSKHPIISWENINVAMMQKASRSLLHGIIEVPGSLKPLHCLCVHLGLFKAERAEQLETLIQRIAQHVPPNEPLLIAGDFNEWRPEALTSFEQQLNLSEVFKDLYGNYAKTFPAIKAALPIDRVYYRGLVVEAGRCLDEKPWRTLSDHLPLFAQLRLSTDISRHVS